jgi:hypothetical protein
MGDTSEHPATFVSRIEALAARRLSPCGAGSTYGF